VSHIAIPPQKWFALYIIDILINVYCQVGKLKNRGCCKYMKNTL